MAYTETHTTGWLDRLGGSFRGIGTGLLIILAGTWLLWYNEGRTFNSAGAIGEAKMTAQAVQDISTVDSSLNGRVIHAIGFADTQDVLRDPVFGVSSRAITLSRSAEYYQWVEHTSTEKRKKLGGGEETVTTYTYSMEWTGSPVDSGSFRDPEYRGRNLTLAAFENFSDTAKNVSFGAYKLPPALIRSIGGASAMTLTSADIDMESVMNLVTPPAGYVMPKADTDDNDDWGKWVTGESNAASASGDAKPVQNNLKSALIHTSGSTVYIGANPGAPSVGDVRVSFKQTPPADVSIIAKVFGDSFEEYIASNGYSFIRLSMGRVSLEKMFADAESGNNTTAWILRVIGVMLVVFGIGGILRPLSVLGDVIPLLGTIIEAGASVVSMLLGLAWSFVVIAVAWIRFRPLIAGGLIAAAAVLVFFTMQKGKNAKPPVIKADAEA